MVLQRPIQFVADNQMLIDFLAILTMKCKHYLTIHSRREPKCYTSRQIIFFAPHNTIASQPLQRLSLSQ